MTRLIEWDSLDLRISGKRVAAMASALLADARTPITRLDLSFGEGLLRVEGTVRKFISLPFRIDISEIVARGRTIRVPLRSASTFGGIPIPRVLFRLIGDRLPAGFVTFEEPATLVVALDRIVPAIVPELVDVEVRTISITDAGFTIALGRGGADPPARNGGIDGRKPEPNRSTV